jgi:hypothetical protein
MAPVQAILQARNHLSRRSRGDDAGTIQIDSSLPHNLAHVQPLAIIQSKKPTPTYNDRPSLCLDAFLEYKRVPSNDSISSRDQVFPGFAHFHIPDSLFF